MRLERALINRLLGHEQEHFVPTSFQFLRYRNTWEEMASRAAASDQKSLRLVRFLVRHKL